MKKFQPNYKVYRGAKHQPVGAISAVTVIVYYPANTSKPVMSKTVSIYNYKGKGWKIAGRGIYFPTQRDAVFHIISNY